MPAFYLVQIPPVAPLPIDADSHTAVPWVHSFCPRDPGQGEGCARYPSLFWITCKLRQNTETSTMD